MERGRTVRRRDIHTGQLHILQLCYCSANVLPPQPHQLSWSICMLITETLSDSIIISFACFQGHRVEFEQDGVRTTDYVMITQYTPGKIDTGTNE